MGRARTIHPQAKQRILNDIIRLAANATEPHIQGSNRTRLISVEGYVVGLVDELVDVYDQVVQQILNNHAWRDKFSEGFITKSLNRLIFALIEHGTAEGASERLEDLIADLDKYALEMVVYVPLSGIRITMDEVKLGKVVLTNMDERRSLELSSNLEAIMMATTHTQEEKAHFVETRLKEVVEAVQGRVCSVFRVVAEPSPTSAVHERN